jgi:hypothetical protein
MKKKNLLEIKFDYLTALIGKSELFFYFSKSEQYQKSEPIF